MPQLKIYEGLIIAFRNDDVEMLLGLRDWIKHVGDLGDNTIMVLMQFKAVKCLDAVLEHCGPEIVDANTGWTHDADSGT